MLNILSRIPSRLPRGRWSAGSVMGSWRSKLGSLEQSWSNRRNLESCESDVELVEKRGSKGSQKSRKTE